MRTYKTDFVPDPKEGCVRRECDLCGRVAEGGYEWPKEWLDIRETTVSCERGLHWGYDGEGATKTEYWIDICPDCFENKLLPWVNSQRKDKPPIEGVEIDW